MVVVYVVALALVLLGVERVWPGRRWAPVAGWWVRALAINGVQIGAVFVAGVTWERWLRGPSVFELRALPAAAEFAVGYLVYVLWLYWFHRARHAIPILWRWLHQLHHSPQRVEVLTAFYKHPLEILIESVITAALFYALLGASPGATFAITTMSGVTGLFYHWNIRTPRWLGYVIQRPESHCVHHQRGVHAYNYSELPLLDIVFGTFKNPATFEAECGFADDRERRITALLLGRDVDV